MDVLTLAAAKKYAKALIDVLGGEVDGLGIDVDELTDDLLIVNQDGDVASKLILNALRQHIWQSEDEALICEEGTATLHNTKKFPFNDSKQTLALANRQRNQEYVILAEATTVAGNIGEITVSDKAVNGFKMAFSGGAKEVAVKYYVIGGFIK